MRELHLFAGIGGGILGGTLLGHRPICAVEINRHCRKVLRRRIKDGILPWFPIWKDVKDFDGKPWKGVADVVCAGFPCPAFSTAGKRKGKEDSRNLWPETARILREVAPRFAFLENVPGLLTFDYFGEILGDLAEMGFDAEWGVVSAASVGAWHTRDRLWILGYRRDSAHTMLSRRSCGEVYDENHNETYERRASGTPDSGGPPESGVPTVINSGSVRCNFGGAEQSLQGIGTSGKARGKTSTNSDRIEHDSIIRRATTETSGRGNDKERSDRGGTLQSSGKGAADQPWVVQEGRPISDIDSEQRSAGERGWCGGVSPTIDAWLSGGCRIWHAEPELARVANGVPHQLDDIRAFGNAQVPQVVATAFVMLAINAGISPDEFGWGQYPINFR